jgi:SAM-dependent methyltransferase
VFGDAAAYERYMGGWSAALADPFLDAVAVVEPGTVVDVGSGTGNLALAAARRWPGCTVLGVDPSPAYVRAATDRARDDGRARFVRGTAGRLPLREGGADAALALLVLNFVPDPASAVAEMARATRPGGVLGAAVWDYGVGMQPLRLFWDAAARVDPSTRGQDEGSMPLAGAGELADAWRSHGLRDVRDGALEVRRRYGTFDDYWQPFLLATGPAGAHVASLGEAERIALRAELESRLGPGPFDLTARAWWVRGTAVG